MRVARFTFTGGEGEERGRQQWREAAASGIEYCNTSSTTRR